MRSVVVRKVGVFVAGLASVCVLCIRSSYRAQVALVLGEFSAYLCFEFWLLFSFFSLGFVL